LKQSSTFGEFRGLVGRCPGHMGVDLGAVAVELGEHPVEPQDPAQRAIDVVVHADAAELCEAEAQREGADTLAQRPHASEVAILIPDPSINPNAGRPTYIPIPALVLFQSGDCYFGPRKNSEDEKIRDLNLFWGLFSCSFYRPLGKRNATAEEIHALACCCVNEDEELFRIFCYHCPPYCGTEHHPLSIQ